MEKTVQVKGWDEKFTRNGKRYLTFHFDGDESYNVFDDKVMAILKESSQATIMLEKKGEFTNLVDAKMVSKADATTQAQLPAKEEFGPMEVPEAKGGSRDHAIKKQTALKAAAKLFSNGDVANYREEITGLNDMLARDILKLADKFLEWLEAE